MCKIVTFTNTAKLDKNAAGKIGGIINKIERDGFGYAVLGENGVFGEKSVFPNFKSRLMAKNVVKLPIIRPQHSTFGKPSKYSGPGIFHGRTSTNDKGLTNCHPMIRNDWHLIHNGVVTDLGPKYDKATTNDSEDVLERLINGIDHVERYLTGYFAFSAIDPSGRLHICRDSRAYLYMAYSSKHETYVFATTESLLKSVCKTLKIEHGPVELLADNIYCIFEGNELVHQQSINPLGFTERESKYASQSLGRSLVNEGWPNVIDATESSNNDSAYWTHDRYFEQQLELENMDRSYQIFDELGKEVDLTDFKRMAIESQLACTVIRPDGTEVDLIGLVADSKDYWRLAK